MHPQPDSCLYFGTFNPIHTGHLMIAQAAFSQFSGSLGLSDITFIPASSPPHRENESDMLPARHRFKMIQLATAANPAFRVSDIELLRKGCSYTIDTVRHLIELGRAKAPVPMIIGSDALAGLATWREPRALIESVRFLQAPRPDHPFISAVEIDGQAIPLDTRPINMPDLSLSSTWVRQLAGQGNMTGLRYAVPEAVRRYIADNRLYRD